MKRDLIERMRKAWIFSGRTAVAVYGSALWLFCVIGEILYVTNGIRLRVIPLALLIVVTIAQVATAIRYVQNPLPFWSRTAPFILVQLIMVLVFALILFQSAIPIW